jgi:hypothetical protein
VVQQPCTISFILTNFHPVTLHLFHFFLWNSGTHYYQYESWPLDLLIESLLQLRGNSVSLLLQIVLFCSAGRWVADILIATVQIKFSFYSGWEVMTGSLKPNSAYNNWVNGCKTQVMIADQSPRLENLAITLHQQWKTKLHLHGSYAKQQLTRWKKRSFGILISSFNK